MNSITVDTEIGLTTIRNNMGYYVYAQKTNGKLEQPICVLILINPNNIINNNYNKS